MIIGIGTDIIQVARIESAMQRQHFLDRAFTGRERERIKERGAQTAAGYFAAKEAVAKALGSGFDGFFLDAIEIINDEAGKPECILSGQAQARFLALGGARVLLSISHDGGFAIAFCVLEGAAAE